MTFRKEKIRENGYEYEFDENDKVKCPVCGKFTFDEPNDFTYCENCGWFNFELLLVVPTCSGPLYMTFDEAKKAYAEGKEIY